MLNAKRFVSSHFRVISRHKTDGGVDDCNTLFNDALIAKREALIEALPDLQTRFGLEYFNAAAAIVSERVSALKRQQAKAGSQLSTTTEHLDALNQLDFIALIEAALPELREAAEREAEARRLQEIEAQRVLDEAEQTQRASQENVLEIERNRAEELERLKEQNLIQAARIADLEQRVEEQSFEIQNLSRVATPDISGSDFLHNDTPDNDTSDYNSSATSSPIASPISVSPPRTPTLWTDSIDESSYEQLIQQLESEQAATRQQMLAEQERNRALQTQLLAEQQANAELNLQLAVEQAAKQIQQGANEALNERLQAARIAQEKLCEMMAAQSNNNKALQVQLEALQVRADKDYKGLLDTLGEVQEYANRFQAAKVVLEQQLKASKGFFSTLKRIGGFIWNGLTTTTFVDALLRPLTAFIPTYTQVATPTQKVIKTGVDVVSNLIPSASVLTWGFKTSGARNPDERLPNSGPSSSNINEIPPRQTTTPTP